MLKKKDSKNENKLKLTKTRQKNIFGLGGRFVTRQRADARGNSWFEVKVNQKH